MDVHVHIIIQVDGKPNYYRFPPNKSLLDALSKCPTNKKTMTGVEWKGQKRGDYIKMWLGFGPEEVPHAIGDSKDVETFIESVNDVHEP